MELKLLHLSDIHFQHYGEHDYLDYDEDLRDQLENDLKGFVKKTGSINAILISGDIAFSSREEEYSKASEWIEGICNICNCKEEHVLTVPGNHDINREIGALILSAHDKFKAFNNRFQIDKELFKYLTNDQDYLFLLNPLKNYIAFAQKYSSLPIKNSLYWEKELLLDDIKVRVRGLNSTIISNSTDDEKLSKLLLGGHQTVLKSEDGVIYLTMCHHPPQWLIDQEAVETDLHARAKIQLYGHKHLFELTKDDKTLKLTAGAVHPTRSEKEWDPRYNLIGLSIFTHKDIRSFKVRIWERIWNKVEMKFVPKIAESGNEFSEFILPIDSFQSIIGSKEMETVKTQVQDPASEDIELINLLLPDPKRKLAYLFFDLPYHLRIEIACKLGLVEDSDENLSSIQKSQSYFNKATELKKLDQLWDLIVPVNKDIQDIINPFK